MKLGGCGDKLTQNVNSMGDVRTSDPKVDETTDKMPVASRIGKRLTISGSQLNTKLHGCVHSAVIGESSTREKILNVLLLGEVDAIRRGRNFDFKKVTKSSQIRHQEFVTKTFLYKFNELRVITSNDHIINIE